MERVLGGGNEIEVDRSWAEGVSVIDNVILTKHHSGLPFWVSDSGRYWRPGSYIPLFYLPRLARSPSARFLFCFHLTERSVTDPPHFSSPCPGIAQFSDLIKSVMWFGE